MDRGGFSAALAAPVLHFNGKLFKGARADGYSLLLTPEQIDLLITAARANWREVEPAIFGTLLERALDPTERHALGAHYTPRAYVERLVLPTVIEPLRADWANAQAAALVLAHEAAELEARQGPRRQMAEARAEVRKALHHQLCTTRVLDPACGSANFLYVTLEHLKRLEGEVLNQLRSFGTRTSRTSWAWKAKPSRCSSCAASSSTNAPPPWPSWCCGLASCSGTSAPAATSRVAEPVVHNYGNIECRDAVLAWDDRNPPTTPHGQLLTRWDGKTFKPTRSPASRCPTKPPRCRSGATWAPARPLAAGGLHRGQPAVHWRRQHARRAGRRLCASPARRLARGARERRLRHVLVAPRRPAGGRRAGAAHGPDHHQQPAPDLQPPRGAGRAGQGHAPADGDCRPPLGGLRQRRRRAHCHDVLAPGEGEGSC
jgi:hypothetical protein